MRRHPIDPRAPRAARASTLASPLILLLLLLCFGCGGDAASPAGGANTPHHDATDDADDADLLDAIQIDAVEDPGSVEDADAEPEPDIGLPPADIDASQDGDPTTDAGHPPDRPPLPGTPVIVPNGRFDLPELGADDEDGDLSADAWSRFTYLGVIRWGVSRAAGGLTGGPRGQVLHATYEGDVYSTMTSETLGRAAMGEIWRARTSWSASAASARLRASAIAIRVSPEVGAGIRFPRQQWLAVESVAIPDEGGNGDLMTEIMIPRRFDHMDVSVVLFTFSLAAEANDIWFGDVEASREPGASSAPVEFDDPSFERLNLVEGVYTPFVPGWDFRGCAFTGVAHPDDDALPGGAASGANALELHTVVDTCYAALPLTSLHDGADEAHLSLAWSRHARFAPPQGFSMSLWRSDDLWENGGPSGTLIDAAGVHPPTLSASTAGSWEPLEICTAIPPSDEQLWLVVTVSSGGNARIYIDDVAWDTAAGACD